jgi:magnesium-protoporphyrin IX monomethyl ester (oxidative) cyclase
MVKTSFELKQINTNESGVPLRHRARIGKVLLIQPPAFCNNMRNDMNPNAPLGIAYIGAVLEQAGYDVKILDAFIEGWEVDTRVSEEKLLVGLPYERIKEIIASENPDVVGVTSMFTSQRKNVHRIAEVVKQVDRDIVVIIGGAHPTSAPESVLEDPNVDVIVLGEGDNTIVPLLCCIESNGNLAELDGIGFHGISGCPVVIDKTTQIENLDTIPFPARHLLPMEKYFAAGIRHGGYSRGKRAVSMISSRGCQYRCNFCTAFKVFTRRPRMRSIKNVLAEIDELVNKYGVDEIFFEDDQLIAKQRRAGDLFDAMAAKYKLVWDTPNGVSPWLLDDEIIGKMKAAGCYRINLAIESGNQYVLDKIINKPVKLDRLPELVRTIRKYDIEVGTFLVVGNIGAGGIETIQQIKESFTFCRKLGLFPHASLLTAYPGSEVLDIAQKNNYLVPGFDWDNLIIQKSQLITPEWTPEQLIELVAQERLKTRWWLLVTSPLESLQMLGGHFIKEPWVTLRKIVDFMQISFGKILRRVI